ASSGHSGSSPSDGAGYAILPAASSASRGRRGRRHYNAPVTIGIIGAGAIAQALAKRLIAADYPVILSNSRGPASLERVVATRGPGASAGTVEAAATPAIVIIAAPWSQLPGTLGRFDHWNDRILIDTTNPIEP